MSEELKYQVGDKILTHPEYIGHLKTVLPPDYVDEIGGTMEQKLKKCLEKQEALNQKKDAE